MNDDLSSILEKFNINKDSISPDMINNIMNMVNTHSINSSTNSSDNSTSSSPEIDIETILKMKTIIDKMNTKNDDPRSQLLRSLRPYLKASRQNKLDQYIQLMNMSKIIDILPFMGGDNNGTK